MPQIDWLEQPVKKLSPAFPEKLAIVDLETTGGSPRYHRVIEIGVLLVENGQLVKRWQTFIHPGVGIPEKINRLTGISDHDVLKAPDFQQIAEDLSDLLEGQVFVAHNVRFDQGFLKAVFKRCGIAFKPRMLCSVKLSRHLFPQFNRHSLNHIIKRFGFNVKHRHRAMDDAEVIWQFFLAISQIHQEQEIRSACELIFKAPALPAMLDSETISALPKSAGVYFFYDANGKLLYIGKSVNIQERVKSHFSQDYQRSRQFRLYSSVARIEYELTPSDFGAQIKESQLIKQLHPDFNLRLKKSRYLYFYSLEENEDGYQRVRIERIDASIPDSKQHYGLFRSQKQAQTQLAKLADNFFLCYKLLGLEKSSKTQKACFRTQLKKCFGACCGQETADLYNERLATAMKNYQIMQWPWNDAVLIRESDMEDRDFSRYHLVDQWRYLGQLNTEQELADKGYCYADKAVKTRQQTNLDISNTPALSDQFFDLDIYFILVRFLLNPASKKLQGIRVFPLAKMAELERLDGF